MRRRAVDTNVLVRLLADNGSDQAARARDLLREGPLEVGWTVLLESEWVLRTHFRLSSNEIGAVFAALLSTQDIALPDRNVLSRALQAHGTGMDFADALHLCLSECEEFLTFDKRFVRKALRLPNLPTVREP